MSKTRIAELAGVISENTAIVDQYFRTQTIATPSFDVDGPVHISIPPSEREITAAHSNVLSATRELHGLMNGPTMTLMDLTAHDMTSLHGLYHFKIAESFPIHGEATFEEISQKTGLNVVDLKRIMHVSMTNNIFREVRPGVVAHSAASRLLAENALMKDWTGIMCEELFPGAPKTVEALSKYGFAQDPSQSGVSLGHNTKKGLYSELQDYPDRARRFAGAMTAFASNIPLDPLTTKFDWEYMGDATVVDVGGGWGPVSIDLAQRFSNLTFIVQDLADVVQEGRKHLPVELESRITFQFYDMLEEQPVKSGDVYFLRAILHNWPDAFCIKILRRQVAAMKRGARIFINEVCLHEPGTQPAHVERRRRVMDLNMLTFFSSHERTLQEWGDLIKEADQRLTMEAIEVTPSNFLLIASLA